MKRKTFLRSTGALIGAGLLPSIAYADKSKKKAVRLAHLTDIHVKPGIIAETGMAKALHHVQKLDKEVDFIVNGGDAIMDALDELPPEQREIFILNEIEERSFREIAEQTNVSINTLLSRKRYAILSLRKKLQRLYDNM